MRIGEEKAKEQALINGMTNWQRTQYSKELHKRRTNSDRAELSLDEIEAFTKLIHPKRLKKQGGDHAAV